MSSDRTVTSVDGHRLTLTNLDKVLYPEAGFTKADVIAYYSQIAPVLLPHVRDRPATFRRYPNGVGQSSFYEKHAPAGTPSWVRTFRVPRRANSAHSAEDEDIVAVVVQDRATLVWAANLAALELHVPMWRARRQGHYGSADLMVFDLDPGAPATIVECCTVACWLRVALEDCGLEPLAKTSGSKGLQLYVPLRPARQWERVRDHAHELAREMEANHGELALSTMTKKLRRGKVLIDWSQNHAAKTTVAPYSLRARPTPTVSTPVAWEEVERCAKSGDPDELVFTSDEVLDRVEEHGDLFSPLLARGRA